MYTTQHIILLNIVSILDYFKYKGHQCNSQKKAPSFWWYLHKSTVQKHSGTLEAFRLRESTVFQKKELKKAKKKIKKKTKEKGNGQFDCYYY